MIPRFDSIAAFDSAIKEGQKNLDALHHQQYLLMLKNDVKCMTALDAPIKDAEKDLDGLKIGLGVTMGANIHGKAGNQLTGSGWTDDGVGKQEDDEQRASNMGGMLPVNMTMKPGLDGNKPQLAANDTPAHVTEADNPVWPGYLTPSRRFTQNSGRSRG